MVVDGVGPLGNNPLRAAVCPVQRQDWTVMPRARPSPSDDPVDRLRRQSAALAAFGGHSLRTGDLDALLEEACRLVSEAIGVELVKVLELLPDGDTMLVRAGINWKPGVVGHATFGAHAGSPSGYALQEDRPVISLDTAEEDRFEIPELMTEHEVVSMVNVVIGGRDAPWGVLEVDARTHRDFDEHDVDFLQNYANLIAAAIERIRREDQLSEAIRRAEMLLGELRHRVRNMLMNIRALAQRTGRSSPDLESFMPAFEARLLALGRAQDLLARGAAGAIAIEDALRQELLAHGAEEGERVRLDGPALDLPPNVAQALAMAFHELATNASKYGALRQDGGRIEVSWTTRDGSDGTEALIRWRESGVALTPPERRGFGSETIERSLPHMLGGEAEMRFHPDGLECTIFFPLPEPAAQAPVEQGPAPDER
jgi:two-component sensor histidine kinase